MTKRVLSLLLTLVMVLSLCVPAIAADGEFVAEAPADVVEEAPEAPVEPEAPEAEEPVEAPVEEPAVAAVAADDPAAVSANVDEETVAALDEIIAEADKILPGIGTTYCIQEPDDTDTNDINDDVVEDDSQNPVDDHGYALFDAALDLLKLYKSEIKDGDKWHGTLSTDEVKDAIDAMQELLDKVSDTACDTELEAINAGAIGDYFGYTGTGWTQQNVDELLDLYKLTEYPGYDEEGYDQGRSDANTFTTGRPESQVLKLQPAYRAAVVKAIEDAREALAMEETNHAAVVKVRDTLLTLSQNYENEDEKIYPPNDGDGDPNNEFYKATLANSSDIAALKDAMDAASAALQKAGVCAPTDKWGASVRSGNAYTLFNDVDRGTVTKKDYNKALTMAIEYGEAVLKSDPIYLEPVNKLLWVFEELEVVEVPVYAKLYGVTPMSNVTDKSSAHQTHMADVQFYGFSVNVRGIQEYFTPVITDLHTYYLKYQIGSGKAQVITYPGTKDPVTLSFNSSNELLVDDGDDESKIINVETKLTAGQTIKVTLWAGMPTEDGSKNKDGVEVSNEHDAGSMTLKLDRDYVGPDLYDETYAGYTGGDSWTPYYAFLQDNTDVDTMYVAFDRYVKQTDNGPDPDDKHNWYDDATVYFVGPDSTAGSFYIDVEDDVSYVAVKFDNTTTPTLVAGTLQASPKVKLVPGDWKVTIHLNADDGFPSNDSDYPSKDFATAVGVTPSGADHSIKATIHVGTLSETAAWQKMLAQIERLSNYLSWSLKDPGVIIDPDNKVGYNEDDDRDALKDAQDKAKAALEAAQKFVDSSADLVDIADNRALIATKATNAMTAAEVLFTTTAGDYSKLSALILKAEAFKAADYTETSWYDWTHKITDDTVRVSDTDTWTTFNFATDEKTALEWAKDFVDAHVYGKDRQFYIDEAVRVFQMFIDKLTPVPADKSGLQPAIDAAEDAFDATKEYTEESLKAYEDALENAKTVLGDPDATQSEVNDAIADLNAAVKGLTVKGDEPVTPEGPKAPAGGTGWVYFEGHDYYFVNGEMKTNYWAGDNDGASKWNYWYYLGSDGKLMQGFQYITNPNGTGWYMLQYEEDNFDCRGRLLTGYQATKVAGTGWFQTARGVDHGKCTWTASWGDYNASTGLWEDGQLHR